MGSLMKLALLVVIHALIIEGARVSPKLDFSESELVQVTKEIKTGKLKGVKVTVDTSELKESKSSGSESSSSSESTSSEKKKTIGVRTDVTFEITSGETNETKTVGEKEIGKDDDNASIPVVPVFKGKPDRGGNRGGGSNDMWSVKPLDHSSATGGINYNLNSNQHHRNSNDDRNRYDASDDKWRQVPQYAIWTTERYNNHEPVYIRRDQIDAYPHPPPSNFIPYHFHHEHEHEHPQPCACKEYPGPFINPRQSSTENQRNRRVHDKLDRPFSNTS